MHTFNHTLEKSFLQADGRYLTPQEMRSIEQFLQSYASRLNVYQVLRDNNAAFVEQALKKMGQEYPDLMQKHAPRCQYDMAETLRYISLAVLRDDEIFFKEQVMAWLDSILLAYKRHNHCAVGYRHLQDVVTAKLPTTGASVVRPYFELVINSLQSHA
jgi:Phycobilisome protein